MLEPNQAVHLLTAMQRTTRIHQLELRRRDNIHKTESIGRDEEARRLKLRALATRDDTAALKEKITQKDAKIMALKKQSDAVRVELDDAKRAARAQETRLKKQDIELANLQVRDLRDLSRATISD